MTIAAHAPNIFDRPRFDGASEPVVFVDDAAAVVASGADLLLVDLDRCPNPADFVIEGVEVIGFGSHVNEGRLAEAREAGFSEALARSVFLRRLPGYLNRASA